MSLLAPLAIVRTVHSLRFLSLLAGLVMLTGCETQDVFTKFRVTNHRGALIAEWTARGSIKKIEQGYRITAVERRTAPPHATETRYPDGWRTTAVGPHIWRWRCPKPEWLAVLDGDAVPVIKPEWTELSGRRVN